MNENPAAEIAALKETVKAQSREIRDLKTAHRDITKQQADSLNKLTEEIEALTLAIQPVLLSAERLNALLIKADQQDGMNSAVKLILGGGFLGALVAAIAGIFNYFSKGMTP